MNTHFDDTEDTPIHRDQLPLFNDFDRDHMTDCAPALCRYAHTLARDYKRADTSEIKYRLDLLIDHLSLNDWDNLVHLLMETISTWPDTEPKHSHALRPPTGSAS